MKRDSLPCGVRDCESHMTDQLQKSILQTLAFWDMFEQPLTKEELYRDLFSIDLIARKLDYFEFIQQLEHLEQIRHKDGFYFLLGRENIVDVRQARVKLIEQKLKIARLGIKKLAKVPFVRAVFVCNTVAMGLADEDSDIDVFIIVKKSRIWLARFGCILILNLFRLRRTKKKIKNKICLSFYVADDCLDLEKIAIKDDVYLIYWLDNLIPIYDPDNLHQSVLQANKWVGKHLPHGMREYIETHCNASVPQKIKTFFEKLWGSRYGYLLEKQAKGIQQAKMKKNYTSVQNKHDTRVIISDSMLKFHETDRREEYREQWCKRCKIFNF